MGDYTTELIDQLEIPDCMGDDWWRTFDEDEKVIKLKDDINNYYNDLINKSDVVRFTKRDGKQFWAAKVNTNLGLCDDCTECEKEDIKKIEGFKIHYE